jgi:sugar O-acyltransferase (sialic acid O-acetyltransferase NeuD family)
VETRIVIAGAGGFGREVHSWLTTSPRFLEQNHVTEIAFVSDVSPVRPVPAPIISTIVDFVPREADFLICAVGSPAGRRTVVDALSAHNAKFATFVHDTAVIGRDVSLHEGDVICPGVILTTDIDVGRHVHININCSIGHDVKIGDFVTLSPACNLMGGVTVESDVFFGTAATVVPGRVVSQSTSIGAGSLVIKDIESFVTAYGNPCVVVRRHEH